MAMALTSFGAPAAVGCVDGLAQTSSGKVWPLIVNDYCPVCHVIQLTFVCNYPACYSMQITVDAAVLLTLL